MGHAWGHGADLKPCRHYLHVRKRVRQRPYAAQQAQHAIRLGLCLSHQLLILQYREEGRAPACPGHTRMALNCMQRLETCMAAATATTAAAAAAAVHRQQHTDACLPESSTALA